jgi:hypothetical protein
MTDLKINPEFEGLIRPLTPEESKNLETMLTAKGCLHPIMVWKKTGEIVDGHNRYRICKKLGIDFVVDKRTFTDAETVKSYIVLNQLSRRNVTPEEASVYRGMLYNRTKKNNGFQGAGPGRGKTLAQNEPVFSTAAQLAKKHGVSEATIKRDGELAAALEATGLTGEFIAGKIDIPRAEIIKQSKETVDSNKGGEMEKNKEVRVIKTKPKKVAWEKVWDSFKRLAYKDQLSWVAYYEDHWMIGKGVVEDGKILNGEKQ